jgi:Flp pilus assembly protein TadD
MQAKQKNTAVLISFGLILITLASFSSVFDNGFVNYDDNLYVTSNPHVLAGLTAKSIRWAFSFDPGSKMWRSEHAVNFHPLAWLSLQLDVQLYGLSAWGFHLTSLLFHAAGSVLFFLVLLRMTGASWRSGLAAALFAIHPLRVESVAWVAERKDVLAAFFGFLTIWFYVGYVRRPGPFRYGLVLLPFILGLLSKPMLVTLPFVLLLLDYWPLGRIERKDKVSAAKETLGFRIPLREKLPLFSLTVVSCILTVLAQSDAIEPLERISLPARIGNAAVSYVRYLAMIFWPSGLAPFYPHPKDSLPAWEVAVAMGVLVSVSVIASWQAKRCPYLIVGWLWYLGTLFPVIGILQVGEQSLADRFTYIPSAGVFMALAWGAAEVATRWENSKFVLVPASILGLAGCLAMTWRQTLNWYDSQTLWEHTLAVTRINEVAENNLGFALLEEGKAAPAEEHFRAALRIRPNYMRAYSNLGIALDLQDRRNEAVECYSNYLLMFPGSATIQKNLGILLAKMGRIEEAVPHLKAAANIDPHLTDANYRAALALGQLKRYAEAVPYCRECVDQEPDNPTYHALLGHLYQELGKTKEAEQQFHEAERLQTGFRPARGAGKSGNLRSQ